MKSNIRALLFFALVSGLILQRGMAATFYQGVTPATVPWPGGIVPYEFDTNVVITPQQKEVYLDGMREWELAANVKFIPRTTESNYVILRFFYQQGTNTFENFFDAPSVMTIDSLSRAQICHETGHLLGFQHEHVRTNRDDYITVNFANLQSSGNGEGTNSGDGIAALYVIDTNSTSFGPYDFESVMHYGRRLFALDSNVDVIAPLPPYVAHYYNRIGNLCISPLDRAGAAYLYGSPTTPLTNIVTTTADVGFGSLRAAIYYANDHPGTTISFNIPTSDPGYSNGVYSIYTTGELPPLVANGTVIDGTTQPGFAGTPIVVIDGSQLLPESQGASGLNLFESSCTVRGLAIQNVTFSAIDMLYNFSQSNHVEGCYLGLAPDGTNAQPNGFQGVNIAGGAHGNVIGGTNASQRNVISGNIFSYGITITETNSDNNVVMGNYLGLDASGTMVVSNALSGVGIFGGPQNTIVGGTNAGAGNVISGNSEYGIFIGDPNTTGTVVQGNFIGTDASGNNALPNGIGGIAVFNGAHNVTIGGNPGARNVISGNGTVGVYLLGNGATNNVVQGNYVGLNAAGTGAVGNFFAGIYVLGGAQDNLIGGTNAGEGNIVSGNFSEGIYIADPGTSSNCVFGNRIGTDAQGVNSVPNGFTGVGIWNTANNNLIGGTNVGQGNLISGNDGNGVSIGDTNTTGNVVQGNLIGTTTNGLGVLFNAANGIFIVNGAWGNLIGGNTPAARNLLSGNNQNGVFFSDPGTSSNQIFGNYIGVDATGTNALPNQQSGIAIVSGASANQIGSPDPATRNIISGNVGDGVFLANTNTSFNVIQGNYIGTDTSGVVAISNLVEGVAIFDSAQSNQIGGAIAGAGNVISASQFHGIFISDTNTMGNSVQGNDIGVGADGFTHLGNGVEGVAIQNGASSNLIGGTVAAARNILSGNGTRGVWMSDPGTVGNRVEGNYIGVAADGVTVVSNLMEGVVIVNGAQGNIVGFDVSGVGAGNVIANSGLEGVAIYDPNTTGNTIRGNAIFNNTKLGINLAGGVEDVFGVTANDPGDPDTGPNNLQNYPVITTASATGGSTGISGTLNSAPNRTFTIDLYRNAVADPSGYGEGQVYLGSTSLTTDGSGNGSFSFVASGDSAGQAIAATATDATTGDTSEFGASVMAINGPPVVVNLTGPFLRNASGFGFNITLQPNVPYRIQATTNIGASNAWVDLTNFTPIMSPVQFVDPGATNFMRRFYRVVSP